MDSHVHAITIHRVYTAAHGAEPLSETPENHKRRAPQNHENGPATDHVQNHATPASQPCDTTGVARAPHDAGAGTSLLTEVTRKAMATDFAILLPPQSLEAVELAVTTLERLDQIEQKLTIYRR